VYKLVVLKITVLQNFSHVSACLSASSIFILPPHFFCQRKFSSLSPLLVNNMAQFFLCLQKTRQPLASQNLVTIACSLYDKMTLFPLCFRILLTYLLTLLIFKITFSFLYLLCVCCINRGHIRVIVRISVTKTLVAQPGFSTSLISKPIIRQTLTQINPSATFLHPPYLSLYFCLIQWKVFRIRFMNRFRHQCSACILCLSLGNLRFRFSLLRCSSSRWIL
jgi:hypothetical protein